MQHTKHSIKKSNLLRSLYSIHAIHDFIEVHHSGTLLINIHAVQAVCDKRRLAYLQVNKVNIVVKCFQRFPILKVF